MEQLIEFATNHWELFLALVVTLALLAITESRKAGKSVSTQQATRLINRDDAILLDIRAKKDFKGGHILNSINIPYADLDKRLSELDKYKARPVIVVCNLGQTSSGASKTLKQQGFENVLRLSGGITEWKAQNLPIETK